MLRLTLKFKENLESGININRLHCTTNYVYKYCSCSPAKYALEKQQHASQTQHLKRHNYFTQTYRHHRIVKCTTIPHSPYQTSCVYLVVIHPKTFLNPLPPPPSPDVCVCIYCAYTNLLAHLAHSTACVLHLGCIG